MNIIARLLGQRPVTAPNLESEVGAQTALIESARAKIAAAQVARTAAIDDFDADRHRAADEEIAEANREIERRENAIDKLNAAHAERLDIDQREAFRRDDAHLAAEGQVLEARIVREYPAAAKTIVALLDDIAAFRDRHRAVRDRATAIGEKLSTRDAEDCRGSIEVTVGGALWRPSSLEKTVGNLPPLVVGGAPFPTGEARFWPRAR